MKSAVIPQVRVEPELRAELEAVLKDGETLSEFVESCSGEAEQPGDERSATSCAEVAQYRVPKGVTMGQVSHRLECNKPECPGSSWRPIQPVSGRRCPRRAAA
jgi:hypothetical protein